MTHPVPFRVQAYAGALIVAAGVVCLAGSDRVLAQSQPKPAESASAPVTDDSNFSFHRIGDGFVRLDSRTGQVARCGWAAANWSCKMVPDERAALESEIARLQRDNVELKKSLLARGLDLPSGMVAEAPIAAPVPPGNVPDPSASDPRGPKALSEADLDRAYIFVRNAWRRLVDMMVDLQRDMQRKS